MTLKELQEQRNKLAQQIREMGDRYNTQNKAWKDDAERSAWDKLNKDYDEVMANITRAQEQESVNRRMADLTEHDARSANGETRPGRDDTGRRPSRRDRAEVTEETRALALAGFFRSSLDDRPSRRSRDAMRECGMNQMQRSLDIVIPPTMIVRDWQRQFQTRNADHAREQILCEQRSLASFSGPRGGVLVPGSFVRSLEANMLFHGGVRQVAEQIVTSTGELMSWPTVDDTSNEGRQLGESEGVDEGEDPDFSLIKWGAYKFTSDEILVDFELLEDSVIDLPPLIGALIGERLGRITNRKATLGSGVGTMRGFMTSAVAGKTSSGGSFDFDDVIDLEHSIDVAYRPGASFMCHDAIVAHLRKLKDGESRYLWAAGVTAADPDTLHGRKLTLNQVLDDTVEEGAKPLVFGDFRKVKLRRVNAIRVYRLMERHRENDQDAFIAFVREDSNVLDAGTKPIKYLQVGA